MSDNQTHASALRDEAIFRRRWLILGVLCLSVFLAVVDNTIVNIRAAEDERAAPRLDQPAAVDRGRLFLVFAGLLLIGGSLVDRYGRGALQIGIFAFAGFSAFAGLSGSTHMLIVARALIRARRGLHLSRHLAITHQRLHRRQGAGDGNRCLDRRRRAGGRSRPTDRRCALKHFWWGSIFFVNLPVAAIALVLGGVRADEPRPGGAPARRPGLRTLNGGHRRHRLHDNRGPGQRLERSTLTIGGFAVALVVLGVFAVCDGARPSRCWTSPSSQTSAGAASFSITVSFFALFGFIFLITQYFQLVRGYDTLSIRVHTASLRHRHRDVLSVRPRHQLAHRDQDRCPLGLIVMGAGFVVAASSALTRALLRRC